MFPHCILWKNILKSTEKQELKCRSACRTKSRNKTGRKQLELIMPCAKTLVKLMIGEKYVDKLNPVSLSLSLSLSRIIPSKEELLL